MIQIFRIPVAKEKLEALSSDERVLLIFLGAASNQLQMMRQLLHFSVNHDEHPEPIVQQAVGIQTQMILRLFMGASFEAREVIVTRYNKTALNAEHRALIDQKGLAAVGDLNQQFGASNMLHGMRNSFAFHHPTNEEIESGFKSAIKDDDLEPEKWRYAHRSCCKCTP